MRVIIIIAAVKDRLIMHAMAMASALILKEGLVCADVILDSAVMRAILAPTA